MTPGMQGADESPPPPRGAKDLRVIIWAIMIVLLGGYVLWQLVGLVTVKNAAPPASVITVPSDATVVGEPRINYENYRVTTYVTVRSADGRTNAGLVDEMGLSAQPTQIGPTPLDWRPVWVYARPTQDGVELRLVYRQDMPDGPVP